MFYFSWEFSLFCWRVLINGTKLIYLILIEEQGKERVSLSEQMLHQTEAAEQGGGGMGLWTPEIKVGVREIYQCSDYLRWRYNLLFKNTFCHTIYMQNTLWKLSLYIHHINGRKIYSLAKIPRYCHIILIQYSTFISQALSPSPSQEWHFHLGVNEIWKRQKMPFSSVNKSFA